MSIRDVLVKKQTLPLEPVKAVLETFEEDTGPTWCREELVEDLEDEGLL